MAEEQTLSNKIKEIRKQMNFLFISDESSKEDLLEIIETRLDFFDDAIDEITQTLKKVLEELNHDELTNDEMRDRIIKHFGEELLEWTWF